MPPKRSCRGAGINSISKRAKKKPKLGNEKINTNAVTRQINKTKLEELEFALKQNNCDKQVLCLIQEVIKSTQLSIPLVVRLLKFCIKVEESEDVVQQILCLQAIDLKTPEGEEILWEAIAVSNTTIAKLLISANINLSVRDSNNLLHKVITSHRIKSSKARIELTTLMLDKGVDVNACDSNGYSILNNAIRCNHCSSQLVEILLQHDANVTFGGKSDFDDILLACCYKPQLLPKLIKHQTLDKDIINERGIIAIKGLLLSERKKKMHIIKNILDLGVSPFMLLKDILLLKKLNKAMLKLLLEYGLDPNCSKLMELLIEYCSDELVLLVLKHRSNVSAQELQYAVNHNTSANIITELLEHCAAVDADDCLATYIVAKEFDPPLPKLLSTFINWSNPSVEMQRKRIMAVIRSSLDTDHDEYLPLIKNFFDNNKLPIYQEKNAQEFMQGRYGFNSSISFENVKLLLDYSKMYGDMESKLNIAVAALGNILRHGNAPSKKDELDMVKMLLDYIEKYDDGNVVENPKRAMTVLWALVFIEDEKLPYFKKILGTHPKLPVYQEKNLKGLTLFETAIDTEKFNMVKMLLDYVENIETKTKMIKTVLWQLVTIKNEKFLRDFLREFVMDNPNLPMNLKVIYRAIRYKRLDMVKMLMNWTDAHKKTPLIRSCTYYFEENNFVSLLLHLRADINAVDQYGYVALSYSCINDNAECMKRILERIAVLVMQEATVNDENLAAINRYSEAQIYYDKCLDELKSMKSIIILKDISLFSILTASSRKLISLSKNSVIGRKLRRLKNSYCIFNIHQIKRRFKFAEMKKCAFITKTEVLREIFKNALPLFVIEVIADYACYYEYMHIDIDEYLHQDINFDYYSRIRINRYHRE